MAGPRRLCMALVILALLALPLTARGDEDAADYLSAGPSSPTWRTLPAFSSPVWCGI